MIDAFKDLLDNLDRNIKVLSTHYTWASLRPEPKQSARFGGGHAYTSKDKAEYVDTLISQLKSGLTGVQLTGNIRLTAIFAYTKNQKDKLPWHLKATQPDIDNLQKPLLDSLKKKLFRDDNIIVEVRARKIRYELPCILLKVETIVESF